MGKHTVQPGEMPRDVAKRHTGDENRYLDLLPSNPHLKTVVDGQTGRPNFDSKDWHEGLVVNIPDRWSESGQMHGVKPTGSVGCGGSSSGSSTGMVSWGEFLNRGIGSPIGYGYLGADDSDINKDPNTPGYDGGYGEDASGGYDGTGRCNWSRDPSVKPYWVQLRGSSLEKIAQTWLGGAWQPGIQGVANTTTLMKVNSDLLNGACNGTRNGVTAVRIPKLWPDPPAVYADRLVDENGLKYTGPGGTGGGDIPGGDDIDRINLNGSGGDSGLIWWILAGGAAVAGAIVLSKKYKGRK